MSSIGLDAVVKSSYLCELTAMTFSGQICQGVYLILDRVYTVVQ